MMTQRVTDTTPKSGYTDHLQEPAVKIFGQRLE